MRFMMQRLIKQNYYHIIKVHQKAKACMIMKIKYLKIKKCKTGSQKQ